MIVPGIAAMSIMSATFTSLAYNVTTLRERGILKRLRGTPLPTSAYLAGLAGNAVANAALQLFIVIVAGKFVFGVDWPRDWGALAVFAVAGVVCFTLLGVALAHAIPNPESAPAYVNAVFLPQILIAGVFYDAERRALDHPGHRAGAAADASGRRPVGRDGRRRGRRHQLRSRCSCSRSGPPSAPSRGPRILLGSPSGLTTLHAVRPHDRVSTRTAGTRVQGDRRAAGSSRVDCQGDGMAAGVHGRARIGRSLRPRSATSRPYRAGCSCSSRSPCRA